MMPTNVDLIYELILDVLVYLILCKFPRIVIAVEHLLVCHVVFVNLHFVRLKPLFLAPRADLLIEVVDKFVQDDVVLIVFELHSPLTIFKLLPNSDILLEGFKPF
jgi:hypothetical protein